MRLNSDLKTEDIDRPYPASHPETSLEDRPDRAPNGYPVSGYHSEGCQGATYWLDETQMASSSQFDHHLYQQAKAILRQQAAWERLMRAIAQPIRQSLDLRFILRTVVSEVRRILQADRVLIFRSPPEGVGNIMAEALAVNCPSVFEQTQAATLFQQRCRQFQRPIQIHAIIHTASDPSAAKSFPGPPSAPEGQPATSTDHQRPIEKTIDTPIKRDRYFEIQRDIQSIPAAAQRSSVSHPAQFHPLDPEQVLSPFGVQTEILVPIVEQDTLWGVLVVHGYDRTRHWQPWETGLLSQLATHLEGVIQQSQLYQKVQRLNADLERQIQARTAELQLASEFEATLKRITDKVRDSLEENQILETAVQELACAIGTSCCNASIYDLEQGTSTIRYEYTMTVSPYQGRVVQLEAFPELYGPLLQGQAFQFCSLVVNPVRGRVATLTCPIVDDQGVLGDLWLINQPYYCFSDQDIRLVQQVANQCAIAIRQARLYQAAQAQVQELERLNRLKDDFLSTVSHELRTPMANIKMATQMLGILLQQEIIEPSSDDRIRTYFQILQSESQREISLINNLLDWSRLDSNSIPLSCDIIYLADWLSTIVHPFRERAASQQQHIDLEIPSDLPPLSTDSSHLERILLELLNNACKYTPPGEQIRVAAQLYSSPAPGVTPCPEASPYLQLSVINTGVEIPQAEWNRIFEKFYRIPNSDPWQHGGTGLGLALIKKLVESINGTIQVESSQNETRFILQLPL